MEIGVYSFGDTAPGRAGERIRELVEEIVLADELGLDVFGVGEHHRPDFSVSAPAIVLAAAAARTRRIRLTSAVTVLSSDDPVRVFQDFATVDQIAGGRAEIMVGRGSFIESFPLFGFDLDDYDRLFAENLELLLLLREQGRVTWPGGLRAPIDGREVVPRPYQDPLPVWIAVGGTPTSVARAGALGIPLALAIIGGQPARFGPLVDLYREVAASKGHDAASIPVGINSHGWVAETSQAAAAEYYPLYAQGMNRIGRERGWGPVTEAQFEMMRSPGGALAVGSPDEVVERILAMHEVFGHQRHMLQLGLGHHPHERVMRTLELFGTRVAPAVRAAVGTPAPATP